MMNKHPHDMRMKHDPDRLHIKLNTSDPGNDRRLQTSTIRTASAKEVTPDEKPKVKRKRRSPEKPWKKPKDMPKRPLSAYNLFFRDERERLLKSVTPQPEAQAPVIKGKKGKKRSGIGFANLATTIAARWKELEDDVKAPYEKIAAEEKKRYDTAVAEWRVKQAVKKKAAKKEADEHRRKLREQQSNPAMFSSERSLGSFSDGSNTYPTEWFHHQTISESEPSERDDSVMVPPVVETSPGSYDRRAYENAAAWSAAASYHENPYAYYGYTTEPYMRGSPELPRGSYMNRGLFAPPDSRTAMQQYTTTGYGDYYSSVYGTVPQASSRSRGGSGDMRMPRAASLPMQYHEYQQHLGAASVSPGSLSGSPSATAAGIIGDYGRRSAVTTHPRSASMPLMQQGGAVAAIETPDRLTGEEPTVTPEEIAAEAFRSVHQQQQQLRQQQSSQQQQASQSSSQQPSQQHHAMEPPARMSGSNRNNSNTMTVDGETPPAIGASNTIDEASVVGATLQSLTEGLDDDAISFITAMKYN